jgi:hypothetical protein
MHSLIVLVQFDEVLVQVQVPVLVPGQVQGLSVSFLSHIHNW